MKAAEPTPPSPLILPEHRDLYYGGAWQAPRARRYAEVASPGTGESLGPVAEAGAEDVDAAVIAARAAFKEWRRVAPLERARILRRMVEVVRRYAGELAMLD